MGFSVNTNTGALVALQNLNKTNHSLNAVQSKINTGLKVAGAKDNASIFAIAQKQRAELAGLSAVKSSLDRATSAIDVALAGAEAVSDLLIQLRENAVSAKDNGNDNTSRALMDRNHQIMIKQIDTIVHNTEFNGLNALKWSGDPIVAIVSTDADPTKAITLSVTDIDAFQLGFAFSEITTTAKASTALTTVDTAIDIVNGVLSNLGSVAKRIDIMSDFTAKLTDAIEVGIGNLVDADLARESANLQSLQVKQQLGLQALSIANQAPQAVTTLFR
jgi:flagellin